MTARQLLEFIQSQPKEYLDAEMLVMDRQGRDRPIAGVELMWLEPERSINAVGSR
jgi:hypothetical protein